MAQDSLNNVMLSGLALATGNIKLCTYMGGELGDLENRWEALNQLFMSWSK